MTKQQHFATLDFPLADASLLFEGRSGPFEMSSSELAREIKALKGSGEDTRQFEMTLQQKFAMPVACLVSIMIALPLGVRYGKRGRGVAAMLSLIVLLMYWLIMAATNALGKNGAIPAPVAAWLPNLFMGDVGHRFALERGTLSQWARLVVSRASDAKGLLTFGTAGAVLFLIAAFAARPLAHSAAAAEPQRPPPSPQPRPLP